MNNNEFKPCGEGDNICSCKSERECGYTTITRNGCGHQLPADYQMRTDGFCYMCDPNITVEELLSDEPTKKGENKNENKSR